MHHITTDGEEIFSVPSFAVNLICVSETITRITMRLLFSIHPSWIFEMRFLNLRKIYILGKENGSKNVLINENKMWNCIMLGDISEKLGMHFHADASKIMECNGP